MSYDVAAILKSIDERSSEGLLPVWGIGNAARDIRGILPCFGDGENALCPTKIFNLASADLWTKEIDEAASRLTWGDEDMRIKSFDESTELPAGVRLMFDAILSSSNLDRDGDLLESKGLKIDEEMSLLWHHIKLQPYGRHVKVLEQNDKWVKCRFLIADTELGRDAATLTMVKALRMSHGFIPDQFEPRGFKKGMKGEQVPIGWHIKTARVYEATQCSIPANSDGRVLDVYEGSGGVWASKEFDGLATAFSRDMLHHELVKSWAKNIFDQRPTQVSGADLTGKMLADDETSGGTDATPPETPATVKRRKKKKCGECGSRCKCGDTHKESEISLETKERLLAVGQALIDLASDEPDEISEKSFCATGTGGGIDPTCGSKKGGGKVADISGMAKTRSQRTFASFAAGDKVTVTYKGGSKKRYKVSGKVEGTSDKDTLAARQRQGVHSIRSGDGIVHHVAIHSVVSASKEKSFGFMQKKSFDLATKGMYGVMDDYIEGSFEWVAHKLSRSAMSHLRSNDIDIGSNYSSYDGPVSMIATFPDSAIFCLYVGNSKYACYRSSWSMNGASMPVWSGTPEAVEIKAQVVTKALAASGVLSAPSTAPDNLDKLTRKMCAALFTADEAEAVKAGESLRDAIETVEKQQQLSLAPLLN